MFIPLPNIDQNSWKGFTLVVPCVSVGQVGQLTTDLLIRNIDDIQRVGYIHDDSLIPMVCTDPFLEIKRSKKKQKEKDFVVCTSITGYSSTKQKLVILQQRSGFIKGRIPSFRKKLIKWIKDVGFKDVVVLTSCSGHICRDNDLASLTSPRFLLSPSLVESQQKKFLEEFQWIAFSNKTTLTGSNASETNDITLPGGGIGKFLFCELCDENISCTSLLMFSNEGNSVAEATTLASAAFRLFSLDGDNFSKDSFSYPSSWNWLQVATTVPPQMY